MTNRIRAALFAVGSIAIAAVLVAVLHHPKPKPADDANPPVIQTPFTAASLIRAGDPVFGNPAAAVTIMDFYDIRCPPCRRMNVRFNRLMKSDHDFRYVPVDYPILGKPSVLGTKALFAAALQHKYRPLRHILMRQKRKPTLAILKADAQTAGIDWPSLKAAMNGPAVTARLAANLARGHGLGLKYVPSWYIGHQRIIGSISYADLVKTVDQAEQRERQAGNGQAAAASHKS
ncbi:MULTISPECIES: DsbA family protein [Acidiphilium]|uniref:Thioredoxin n=1 Tax=Acidiphilium rubrum TaxID=526 RepID=A0A8G2CIQ0_ACIRU|nr:MULTISPECIES: thioredoxin domain-containing protein [Acidiphilium]SIQ32175.1 Thioredoxin [Acidiphilium rubrum]